MTAAREIVKFMDGDEPAVIAGDFNAIQSSGMLDVFEKPWNVVEKSGSPLTFPSKAPEIEIDHILVRGLKVVEKARVLDEKVASDHRPVIAVLDIINR